MVTFMSLLLVMLMILDLLGDYLQLKEADICQRLVGLGCDGASVNRGKKAGVAQ
jgi:hypothetical protein